MDLNQRSRWSRIKMKRKSRKGKKWKQRNNRKRKQRPRGKRTKRDTKSRNRRGRPSYRICCCPRRRCPLPSKPTKPRPTPIIDRCFPYTPIPQVKWKQSPTEKFMERLWAFKRINYLLGNQAECTKGIDEFADNGK